MSNETPIWDTHVHVFPYGGAPTNLPATASGATLEEFNFLRGCHPRKTNAVFVQPSALNSNNDQLIQTLQAKGASDRGIVVLPDLPRLQECEVWKELGVRGVRYAPRLKQGGEIDHLLHHANILRDLNWHVQVYADSRELPAIAKLLHKAGLTIVVDHLARIGMNRISAADDISIIKNLLKQGQTWLKFSGPYNATPQDYPYIELGDTAREIFEERPDRIVWGSDWPHPNQSNPPSYQELLSLLEVWGFDEAEVAQIRSTNPLELYR